MRRATDRILYLALPLVLIAWTAVAVPRAFAAPPSWAPNFPMRAGNVILIMVLPVPGATEYKVLRKIGDGQFAEVYRGPSNNYTESGVDPSKTVTYKVIPIVGGKEGEPSTEGVIAGQEKIKAPVMEGVMATTEGVQLRWSLSSDAAFYNLYRAEDKDADHKLVTSAQQNTFTDKNVKPGKTYFYRVTAVDRMSLESEKSKTASASIEKPKEAVRKKAVVVKKLRKAFSSEGEHFYEFQSPASLAVAPNGEIFVCDAVGIQVLSAKGEYLRRIPYPKGWGEAFGMRMNADESLTLAFPYKAKVATISSKDGTLLMTYDIAPPEKLTSGSIDPRPNSFAFDGEGNLWVADAASNQIAILDAKGKEIGRVGVPTPKFRDLPPKEWPPDALASLSLISYNPYDGKMYVVLALDAYVKVIDAKTRKVVKTFGGRGTDAEQFTGLAGFGFRKNGNVLVFDNLGGVVKEFSPTHEYLQSLADVVDNAGNARLSFGLSAWMTYLESPDRYYFANKMEGKVYALEPEK